MIFCFESPESGITVCWPRSVDAPTGVFTSLVLQGKTHPRSCSFQFQVRIKCNKLNSCFLTLHKPKRVTMTNSYHISLNLVGQKLEKTNASLGNLSLIYLHFGGHFLQIQFPIAKIREDRFLLLWDLLQTRTHNLPVWKLTVNYLSLLDPNMTGVLNPRFVPSFLSCWLLCGSTDPGLFHQKKSEPAWPPAMLLTRCSRLDLPHFAHQVMISQGVAKVELECSSSLRGTGSIP